MQETLRSLGPILHWIFPTGLFIAAAIGLALLVALLMWILWDIVQDPLRFDSIRCQDFPDVDPDDCRFNTEYEEDRIEVLKIYGDVAPLHFSNPEQYIRYRVALQKFHDGIEEEDTQFEMLDAIAKRRS